MTKELQVEIISPNGKLFLGNCNMVVIPGTEGEIGVMYGHELILARLKQGEIAIYNQNQNVTKKLEISGGFAKLLKDDRLLILVDG